MNVKGCVLMASIVAAYNYEVKASLVLKDGKEYDLMPESFKYIIIDNDYDNMKMPQIFINLNLNTKMYNRMVDNINSATISFFMYKYDKDATTKLKSKYIEGSFIYFMDTNPSFDEDMEDDINEEEEDSTGKDYKLGTIGLLQVESLNNNKKMNNAIIKNSRLASIVHKYTSHMNMVIEPFTNNPTVSQLIIPPMDSVTKLLNYLNSNYSFYSGKSYRYYRDFDVTYLLSTRGTAVGLNDGAFDTIIVDISDKVLKDGKENSITIDDTNKAYVIPVPSSDTDLNVNITKDKSVNSIIAVNTDGKTNQVELNIPKNENSLQKLEIKRVKNGNTDSISSVKDTIDSSSIVIGITKTEMDNSILTPNKRIQVKYRKYKQYNGDYILSSKKEVYVPQEAKTFVGSVSFVLRKVV